MEERKYPGRLERLKNYDYSENGYYFVTICTDYKKYIFGKINTEQNVVRPLAAAFCNLTTCGKCAEKQLLLINERFPSVFVDKYVIMPNHIHAIIKIDNGKAAASSRTTLSRVIRAYKSLTTKSCRESGFLEKVWQEGFYDHVIRSEDDYLNIWSYIDGNPSKWLSDEYYI